MNTKKLLVSLVAIASVLVLVSMVSASDLVDTFDDIKVNGVSQSASGDVSVVAGQNLPVQVIFTAEENATNVRVKVTIEGEKKDNEARTEPFDVEAGKTYTKSLNVQVPYDLKDDVSDDLTLSIKAWNGDYSSSDEVTLRVQRPSYNADIKLVTVANSAEAGETISVDVVVKNRGYNNLDDVLVTASISALGVSKSAYLGDIIALEDCSSDCDDDDEDTVTGRMFLTIPYSAEAGVYALDVKVENDDTTSNAVKQIAVKNDFSSNVIVTSSKKTVAAGEEATFDLLIVNPTNKLKVYRIVTESSGSVTSSASEAVVAVPAGSSKTVKISAKADATGTYNFDVNVLSGEELAGKVTLTLDAQGASVTSPIVVLTIILAIVFVVLLVVLIVLLSKKPEKTEEFGESYY